MTDQLAETVTVRADDLRVVLDSITENKSTGACNFAWEKECAARLRAVMNQGRVHDADCMCPICADDGCPND